MWEMSHENGFVLGLYYGKVGSEQEAVERI